MRPLRRVRLRVTCRTMGGEDMDPSKSTSVGCGCGGPVLVLGHVPARGEHEVGERGHRLDGRMVAPDSRGRARRRKWRTGHATRRGNRGPPAAAPGHSAHYAGCADICTRSRLCRHLSKFGQNGRADFGGDPAHRCTMCAPVSAFEDRCSSCACCVFLGEACAGVFWLGLARSTALRARRAHAGSRPRGRADAGRAGGGEPVAVWAVVGRHRCLVIGGVVVRCCRGRCAHAVDESPPDSKRQKAAGVWRPSGARHPRPRLVGGVDLQRQLGADGRENVRKGREVSAGWPRVGFPCCEPGLAGESVARAGAGGDCVCVARSLYAGLRSVAECLLVSHQTSNVQSHISCASLNVANTVARAPRITVCPCQHSAYLLRLLT